MFVRRRRDVFESLQVAPGAARKADKAVASCALLHVVRRRHTKQWSYIAGGPEITKMDEVLCPLPSMLRLCELEDGLVPALARP